MEPKTLYLENVLGPSPEAHMAIREIPFFRGCSDGLVELVYRYGRLFSLAEGEALTREGEFDQWVYLILNGHLSVYVGQEQVDTIHSSLVGEGCILSEPRKATLRAGQGGVNALGVDMALLDQLNKLEDSSDENIRVYLELLARIVGALITRVASLEFNQLDLASRASRMEEAEAEGEIIEGLKNNGYMEDRYVNLALYTYLSRQDKMKLALSLEPDQATINTRRLYALCVNNGQHSQIFQLAQVAAKALERPKAAAAPVSQGADTLSFYHYVGELGRAVEAQYERIKANKSHIRKMSEFSWRHHFKLDGDLSLDLVPVLDWLRDNYEFSRLDLIETLSTLLRETSKYTARINAALTEQAQKFSASAFLKRLEKSAMGNDLAVDVLFATNTAEQLVPVFSQTVLQVHLIQPWLKKLGLANPQDRPAVPQPTAKPVMEASPSDDLLSSLFG